MVLRTRTATAFRWRPTMTVGQVTDFVRIRDDGDAQLVAMANAYDSGFSTCYAPGARLLLDAFDAAWTASSGPATERLRDAFDRAQQRFVAESPALVSWDPDFPETPSAVLIAIVHETTALHAAWISGDVAILVRRGRAIASTTPDTLYERFRRENPGVAVDIKPWSDIASRLIGLRAYDQDPPSFASIEVAAGDTLLVMNCASRNDMSLEEAAAAALHAASPTAIAEHLANIAWSRGRAAYAAIAVVQFDEAA